MSKLWASAIIFLIVAIISGGIVLGLRLPATSLGELVIIARPETENWQDTVYIHGAVNIPGIFPTRSGDTIDSLIQAAGGARSSSNHTLELIVGGDESGQEAQKIDINRAEPWLLEALPDIGETLARRIVDYRAANGDFRTAGDLLKVPGIGTSVYDKIKNLITVADR